MRDFFGRALDEFQIPSKFVLYPFREIFTVIAQVPLDYEHSGEFVSGYVLQEEFGALRIRDICRVNVRSQEESIAIHKDVPFPAFDFFPPSNPTGPP